MSILTIRDRVPRAILYPVPQRCPLTLWCLHCKQDVCCKADHGHTTRCDPGPCANQNPRLPKGTDHAPP